MSGVMLGPNHPDFGKPFDYMPPAGSGPRSKPPGRWSRDYDACQRCGRSDRRYNGRGLCGTCYQRAYINGEFEAAS